MAIYSLVASAERHGSQSFSFDIEGGGSATVDLYCAWADRYALVADVVGNRRVWPHGGFVSPPQAANASIKPIDGEYIEDGQACEYELALVTINYNTKIDDLYSESLEPNAEFVIQDHKRFRWTSQNGKPLLQNEAPGKLRRSLNLVRTLFQIDTVPTICLSAVGSINDADYVSASLGLTFPESTLLFTPPQMARTWKTDGTKGWTITTKFAYRPETWNKFWRAESQSYEEIFDINSGTPHESYPQADFSSILF